MAGLALSSEADWSMMPVGTPTNSFSARRAIAASSRRGYGQPGQFGPCQFSLCQFSLCQLSLCQLG